MIVKLPNTTTNDIDKRITSLRNEDGAIALGRMLTLVTAPDTGDIVEDSIEAATGASREHPCRIIVVISEDRGAPEARLDGQLRVGGSHFKYHANASAEPVLAAWGIDTDGKPVFVGLDAASSESGDAWEGFLTGGSANAGCAARCW